MTGERELDEHGSWDNVQSIGEEIGVIGLGNGGIRIGGSSADSVILFHVVSDVKQRWCNLCCSRS